MADNNERKIERIHNMFGGKGDVIIEHIFYVQETNEKCSLFASVTLHKDCSLGYHEHHGEEETYYILSGEGLYEDRGTTIPAKPGDRFVCNDGEGHSLVNTGDIPLVFLALIMKR